MSSSSKHVKCNILTKYSQLSFFILHSKMNHQAGTDNQDLEPPQQQHETSSAPQGVSEAPSVKMTGGDQPTSQLPHPTPGQVVGQQSVQQHQQQNQLLKYQQQQQMQLQIQQVQFQQQLQLAAMNVSAFNQQQHFGGGDGMNKQWQQQAVVRSCSLGVS